MHVRGLRFSFLTIWLIGFSAALSWAATPQFAVTAANVTMPLTGLGSSSYTVTAIPNTGTLGVVCQYSGPATEAKIPTCTYGPIVATPVTAGQTVTGTVYFYPYGSAIPLARNRTASGTAGVALAGAVLLGLAIRRRARGWLALMVLAVGSLAGGLAISACTGAMDSMTPGTYQYTITAGNSPEVTSNPTLAASTNITVTVP